MLIDATAADSADAEFPAVFTFSAKLLLGTLSSVARLDGDTVTIELANGHAEYSVERTASGLLGTLVAVDRFDAPPIDEHRAFELQLERRALAVAEIVETYDVDELTAERIAVDHGKIPPRPAEWALDSSEA